MITFSKGKMLVSSRTPSKTSAPHLNRQQRRAFVYSYGVRRLFWKVLTLRRDMQKAGIRVPGLPKFRNRNVLTGYMSQLVNLANESC